MNETAPLGTRSHGSLRRILAMEVVSGVGDGVFWIALVSALVARGVGASGFALAAMARFGPHALIGAPAGVAADRFDRRRLLVALDLARAATMAALALWTARGTSTGVGLLIPVVVAYTLAAPYRPVLTAALPLVVGERELRSSNARISTTRQIMTFLGPLVGVFVVERTSPAFGFAVNAASFVASAVLIGSVAALAGRPRGTPVASRTARLAWAAELVVGWRAMRSTVGLAVVASLVFVMYAARGAELVLHVSVASERLGLGPSGVGLLTGSMGLGALAALPVAGRLAESRHAPILAVGSLATTSIPLAALARLRAPAAGCAVLVVVGAGVVVFESVSVVILQRLARVDALAGVFGVVTTASNAGKLMGALVTPAVIAVAGLRGALLLWAGAVAVAGVGALPGLRRFARTAERKRVELRPITSALGALALFADASPQALDRMAGTAVEEHVAGGTVLIRQGDPATDLFVARSGTFSVFDHDRLINTMSGGDWFGEIGLVQGLPRSATVRADTDARVWRIPGEVFLSALRDAAAPPAALLDAMADRLSRTAAARAGAA